MKTKLYQEVLRVFWTELFYNFANVLNNNSLQIGSIILNYLKGAEGFLETRALEQVVKSLVPITRRTYIT